MKKLFLQHQIAWLDRATIEHEPISSVDLMERASRAAADWIIEKTQEKRVVVVAGPGNNGGDGLAIARMLKMSGRQVNVCLLTGEGNKVSADNAANQVRLSHLDVQLLVNPEKIDIPSGALIVDALFGTGLKRPLEGRSADYVRAMNRSGCKIISIDLPSGVAGEETLHQCDEVPVVKAKHTLSFQFPKIAFFAPEVADYVGRWHVLDIKLSKQAIDEAPTDYFFTTNSDLAKILKPRHRFADKNVCGRAVLFAGSKGMMGAATLAAKACMRSGVGVLTAVVPECGRDVMQISVPEAMTDTQNAADNFLSWNNKYANLRADAIGVGPGLSRHEESRELLKNLILSHANTPMVIDADGLFHLAETLKVDANLTFPAKCILTPHAREFDRLTSSHSSFFQRLQTARDFARKHSVVIVLKDAFTAVVDTKGVVTFNTNGNSGLATAGSGDTLTGIILGLLAQGYEPHAAATLGVGLHALAGDFAAKKHSREAMIASDIAAMLGKAFIHLHEKR